MKEMRALRLVAFDLGASSGRAMLGRFDGERLSLEEITRFENGPVRCGEHLYTDALRLWSEILHGLEKAAALGGSSLASVGVDTWGVDFALLDRRDMLLANPFHYRDPYTRGTLAAAQKKVSLSDIYTQTGNQLMEFNTLFQLLALQQQGSPALHAAQSLLMLPDLFHFWLCGQKSSEFTVASTSQCYNPTRREWAWDLLQRLELPAHIFQPVIPAGTRLGALLPWIAAQTGCPQLPVIVPAGHDTGGADGGGAVERPAQHADQLGHLVFDRCRAAAAADQRPHTGRQSSQRRRRRRAYPPAQDHPRDVAAARVPQRVGAIPFPPTRIRN